MKYRAETLTKTGRRLKAQHPGGLLDQIAQALQDSEFAVSVRVTFYTPREITFETTDGQRWSLSLEVEE